MGLSDITFKTEDPQQVWHEKEPSLLKAISAKHIGLNLKPFTGIVDVSI